MLILATEMLRLYALPGLSGFFFNPGGRFDSPCRKAQDRPLFAIYSIDSRAPEIELTNDMSARKTSSLRLTRGPGQLTLESYEEARWQSWPWSMVCGYSQRRNW